MELKKNRTGRWMAAVLALAAAGCASNRGDAEGDRRSESSGADTAYGEGTWRDGGTGTGGAGDPAPMDPGAPDTGGIYGDPNRWPTGPLPGDTGVGGAGDPMPDSAWTRDTLDLGVPESPEGRIPPDDGAGPDIF